MTSKELPLEQEICLACKFCCNFLIVTSTVEEDDKRKNLVYFNRTWGCHVLEHDDNKTFEIAIPLKCQWLTPNGCSIYNSNGRPKICGNFKGRTSSAFMQRNCKLFEIRMKEQKDAETGDPETENRKR